MGNRWATALDQAVAHVRAGSADDLSSDAPSDVQLQPTFVVSVRLFGGMHPDTPGLNKRGVQVARQSARRRRTYFKTSTP